MQDFTSYSSGNFFIHFDVATHKIPIEQSIVTEQAVKIITDELNKNIFEGKLKIQIYSFSAIEGSKLKKFGATILVGGGFILGQLSPDITNGIVMGLGDGREVKEYIRDWTAGSKNIASDFILFTKNFFEKDPHSLEGAGLYKEQFYKAYDARNSFYTSAIDNQELKGIGFDNSEKFPISKDQFPYKLTDLRGIKRTIKRRKIHILKVVSSINAQENAEDAWRVKDIKKGSTEYVYMKDTSFYKLYWDNDLKVHTMIAQVKYLIEDDGFGNLKFRDKGKEIEKVFDYDGNSLIPFPSNYQLEPFPLKFQEDSKNILDARTDELQMGMF